MDALLLLLQDYLREHSVGDATNREGAKLIGAFWNQYVQAVKSSQSDHQGQVVVRPRMQEKNGSLQASFKITDKKRFVIKDLDEFNNNVKNSENALYGSNTYINHSLHNFTENSRKWIDFIDKALTEENA